jgi:mannosylglycerate hydrolase
MEAPQITVYLVPHTHWDREWYKPFQVFRARLLDVVDSVLDILAKDPDYRCFTLDGQAVALTDYLAQRPERREEIKRLVREGRLRIGPWYVLADEFLVSPESLVRNLMLGRKICRDFGAPMPVAYTPDSFGHISQLPLLAQGFGLDSIIFERGVGDEGERLKGEFRWIGADNSSEVYAAHLLGTYSAAAALGHADWELNDAYSEERAVQQVKTVLYGAASQETDLPAFLRESFERLAQGILPYATNGAVLLLNGSDHLFPQANLPDIIGSLSQALPEVRFVHGDLETFIAAARKPLSELETYHGEFRGSRYQHVLSGVLSSRLYLKQANHRVETLLERYAEPLAALAHLDISHDGQSYPTQLLAQAWRLLLHNHPHDSICGCSLDVVHRENMMRFASAGQVGEVIVNKALQHLVGPPGENALAVFNPLPYAREAVLAHTLELPLEADTPSVLDEDNSPLPCQCSTEEVYPPGRSDFKVNRTTLRFAASLPPFSLSSYRLGKAAQTPATDLHAAARDGTVMLENDRVKLEITAGGALTLADKASGESYALNLHLEDVGDAGDEYDFSPVPDDQAIPFTPEHPELLEAGPVSATARLQCRATLPRRLSDDRKRREGSAELPLTLDITLEPKSPLLRLNVRLENHAEDHRLRLRASSGCHTDHVWADGHFDVLKRPVRPPEGKGWFQKPQPTNHQRRFVAVSDGKRGLAVLNRGLPEYEAIPAENGTDLAVTLLRCVGWLSREDLTSRPQGAGPSLPTPEAQCPGQHTFELALLPFSGPWDESGLIQEAASFVAPPLLAAAEDVPEHSWLELTPPLELSAFKRAENRSSVIRLYNPAAHTVQGSLRLWDTPLEAYLVNLAEERQSPLPVHSPVIPLELTPKQVTTLEFIWAEKEGGEAMQR